MIASMIRAALTRQHVIKIRSIPTKRLGAYSHIVYELDTDDFDLGGDEIDDALYHYRVNHGR